MRRVFALLLTAAIVVVGLQSRPARAMTQQRHLVDLPTGTILGVNSRPIVTADGSVGFVAPASGDTVVAFGMRTGETLARVQDLGVASGLALFESSERRLLVVTIPAAVNETRSGKHATASRIVVLDVSNLETIFTVSTFHVADGVALVPGARAEFARDGRFCVIAVAAPVGAVLSFDTSTGQQVGALTLDCAPDEISVADASSTQQSHIAILCSKSNEVAITSLDEDGVLLPLSTFQSPQDAPLSPLNAVHFSHDGRFGYVGSVEGLSLLSFSTETGELIDRIGTEGASATMSVYHSADREIIALSNVTRLARSQDPTDTPESIDQVGIGGVTVVGASSEGKLEVLSRFTTATGEDVSPNNTPDFTADGARLIVPLRTGSVVTVDVATGKELSRQAVENHVQSIAVAPLAESVAVVSAGADNGRIEVLPAAQPTAEPKTTPETAPVAEEAAPKPEHKREEKTKGAAPNIARLAPPTVQTGRRKDLEVTAVGSDFEPGATVLAGGATYSALVNEKGRRIQFTLPAALLAAPAEIPVQVQNPGGGVSNTVTLSVVAPFAPILSKLAPESVLSGSGGTDLKIRGDHFRDGAIVRMNYTDYSGNPQVADLKTYRLSFTSIVAHVPYALTKRSQAFAVSVVDREGDIASMQLPFVVLGPAISGVSPERALAGELAADESLDLKITGTNFHPDVVVYIRKPLRGDSDEGPFSRVASGSVSWKSAERILVSVPGEAVAYSGPLVLRVINPVAGIRARLGDVAEYIVPVAGPVVASTSPASILAGTDKFTLKLTGTDFRAGASVNVVRDSGGGANRRVVIDDPTRKDKTRISVPFDTPSLLKLVARPGTLFVRVLNPTVGKGDPSPAVTIQVVGPAISAFDLIPRQHDPDLYRLTLTGTNFAEGALVQLLTTEGAPVGKPIDAKVKSDTELVIDIGRGRVTNLRTFKVRVINPGGPYNADGVSSSDFDVSVQ